MSDKQIDAAADGAFSGKLADPSDTLTKRGGKGHVVYEGQEYDRLAWTRRCAALGYTLAAGEGAILNAALIEVEKERDALRKACELFVEWLGREDAGSGVAYEERRTPSGEAKFMEWYQGNIDLCHAAVDAAKAVLAAQP